MNKRSSRVLWSSLSKQPFLRTLNLFFVFAIALPSPALGADEFFRQTKENFTPRPFVQPDYPDGAFVQSVPISVPPGRSGLQPDLKLTYSSALRGQDSIFGYGWSLDIPYIERLNKLGVDNLYNQDREHSYFYSPLSGELIYIQNSAPSSTSSYLGYAQRAEPLSPIDTSLSPSQRASLGKLRALLDDSQFLHGEPFTDDTAAQPNGYKRTVHRLAGDVLSEVGTSGIVHLALSDLPQDKRASLKGQVIAQLGRATSTIYGDYRIEILSTEPIDGGVQVFARAWDKKGEPIGFGLDGSVEIERFRIINPPIMVPDGTKRTVLGPDGTEHQVDNFKEDPRAALLTSLEHIIKVKKEKFDGLRIVPGKVGNTTSTFYPSDGAYEDGSAGTRTGGASYTTWAAMLAGSGDGTLDTSSCFGVGILAAERSGGGGDSYSELWRGRTTFDTSALPDGDTISSATLSLYGDCAVDASSGIKIGMYGFSTAPASNGAISASDFDHMNTTAQSATTFTTAGWSTAAYNNFALNATGLTNISKTGASHFSFRDVDHDVGASASPQNAGTQAYISAYATEQGGSTNDPKLVVEHAGVSSSPSTPNNLWANSQTNPGNIATSNPQFSAVVTNSSSTLIATDYQIQITTSSSTWASPLWDSGKKTLASSTPPGMRTPDIYATTTSITLNGTKYYWRIRFWDSGGPGNWSTTGDFFTTMFQGDYGAKVENGEFFRYTHSLVNSTDVWYAYDKKGTRYFFGSTSSTQWANASGTQVYRWLLEKTVDPNGNTVDYSYVKDAYRPYPYKITYGGQGGSGPLHEIEFALEDRLDIATSSVAGFPIVTKKRVKEILVRTNGVLTHRYQLAYALGNNGVRSILRSVQESGWAQGVGTTTLPATTLGYSTSTEGWTENSAPWGLPAPGLYFAGVNGEDGGLRVFDASGDVLPDILYKTSGTDYVHINTGSSWATTTNTGLALPVAVGGDNGVRLADINGDGQLDIVRSFYNGTSYKSVHLGGGGWSSSSNWSPPIYFSLLEGGVSVDQGVRLVDVNGDGLADIVKAKQYSTYEVYINNGSQWVHSTVWSFPTFIVCGSNDAGVRLVDVNGDQLVDVVMARGAAGGPCDPMGVSAVYLNTGAGWSQSSTWSLPVSFIGSYGDTGARFSDLNGDGLPDIVMRVANTNAVYLNTGSGWTEIGATFPTEIAREASGGYPNKDAGVVIDDVNGDGLPDVIKSRDAFDECICAKSDRRVWLKDGVKADFLTNITNETGGTVTVAYDRTSKSVSGVKLNPSLQIGFDVVKTITNDPGFGGAVATTTYEFMDGRYYYAGPHDRQFAGYASTTRSNSLGHTVRTFYHQGNSSDSANGEYNDHVAKAGKPYRIDTLDGTTSANLFSRTINKWARADYGDGRNFVKLHPDACADLRRRLLAPRHRRLHDLQRYDRRRHGTHHDYGEVSGNSDGTWTDTGTDIAVTTYTYAASSTNSVMSLPSRELVADQSGNTVRDTKWYYDDLSFGLRDIRQSDQGRTTHLGLHVRLHDEDLQRYGHVSTSPTHSAITPSYAYDATTSSRRRRRTRSDTRRAS